jgi:hypothetical protein
MSEPGQDEGVTRGAAEEMSDAPLTETEREVSKRPPSDRPAEEESASDQDEDGGVG